MTAQTIEHTDVFTQLTENMDIPLACEGEGHPQGQYGHQTGAPAAYSMHWECPTCQHTESYLMCDGRYRTLRVFLEYGETLLNCDHSVKASEALVRVVKL